MNHLRRYVLLLIVLLCAPVLKAQQNGASALADSLIAALPAHKQDTVKAGMLYRIGYCYLGRDPDEGIKYMQLSLEMAQQLNWKRGIANAYAWLGSYYGTKPDYPKSLTNFFGALKIFEELGDNKQIGSMLGNIAAVYGLQKDHRRSVEYSLKALQIEEAIGDAYSIAVNVENIGAEYIIMGQTDSALECFNRALKLFGQVNDKASVAGVLTRIASALDDSGDYSKALEHHFRALKISEEEGHTEYICVILGGIGNTYFKIASDSARKIKPDGYVMPTRHENLQKAITYLERSIDSCRKYGYMGEMSNRMTVLSQAYELAGRDKDALRVYKEHMAIRDSIFSTDNKVKIAELGTQREAELKEKQIAINQLEIDKKKNERMLFSGGLLLLAIGIVAVFRSFRSQRKVNSIQKEALAQKEMLMKEIHHRVKNNLQVISTLLDLQLVNITDGRAKDAITESNTRLRAISLIHQQLYQEEHITTIEFAKFTADLYKQLSGVFSKPGQYVTLNNNIPAGTLDIDTAVPLGMILNELMTNSYKYAFGGDNGSISISTEKRGDQYALTYHDSGPGMPDEFDIKTSKSLGMRIIYRLSRQVGGAFVYSKEKNTFVITFKDAAARKLID